MAQTSAQREKRKASLRQRILAAARALFAARGYESVTMRAIARRVGYTATALYYHFPDKKALLHELCSQDFRTLQEYFRQLARIPDPVERLQKAGLAYVRFGLEHPQHYQFMFLTPYPEPAPHEVHITRGDPTQDSYAFLLHTVQEALAARRFRPEFTDAEQIAQMLWAAMHGIVALHLSSRDSRWLNWRPTHKTAERMGEVFLRGLLREPVPRPGASGRRSRRKTASPEARI